MRQARRGKPRLRITKPCPDSAEDRALRHPQTLEADDGVTAGQKLVERVEHALDVDTRRVHRARNIVALPVQRIALVFRHDDRELAPTAPVISHFVPSMTKSAPLPGAPSCAAC